MPIAKLSEEPQEAQNKDFRNIRQDYTSKFSRVAANEDLLNHFFTSFDPVLSSKRNINTNPNHVYFGFREIPCCHFSKPFNQGRSYCNQCFQRTGFNGVLRRL
jgi:hypothetical protein